MIDNKVLRIKKEHVPFIRERSVFKEWEPDSHKKIVECVNKDEMDMKLHKFMSSSDVNQIKAFLMQHYYSMKELRMGAIAFFGDPFKIN